MSNGFNKYISPEVFASHSFEDAIGEEAWGGFTKIKYNTKLIQKITTRFPDVIYQKSSKKVTDFKGLQSICGLYLVSDNKKNLLKVGQTVNPYSRFSCYYSISEHFPLRFDLFTTESYELQDLYEDKIRNFLEYLGYYLPADATSSRLKMLEELK
jgi:hypothetical protein